MVKSFLPLCFWLWIFSHLITSKSWGASIKVASDISNGYQYGEGEEEGEKKKHSDIEQYEQYAKFRTKIDKLSEEA
jgi:hypothetical protein